MELSSLVHRLGSTLSTSVLSFKLVALIVIEKFQLYQKNIPNFYVLQILDCISLQYARNANETKRTKNEQMLHTNDTKNARYERTIHEQLERTCNHTLSHDKRSCFYRSTI